MNIPTIMTVAGSDSGGGAGIQADLKTITVLGGFGVSAITALTAQNGAGVTGIHAPDPEFVCLQITTLTAGFPIQAAKSGMLFSAPIIEAVAASLETKNFPLVVDPVAVSQTGHRLLEEGAVDALVRRMLPLADLLTPNKPEAEALTGLLIDSPETLEEAGRRLLAMGAKNVLIKGGHFDDDPEGPLTDWFFAQGEPLRPFTHRRILTPNNHGTGCTLSAAIATFWGQGKTLPQSIEKAQEYLERALAASFTPGLGCGPPNFLAGRAV